MSIVTLNPYQTLRSWNRKKEEFPDIKGSEELFTYTFLCIEKQIAYMTKKCDSLYDEDVALAYAICGLRLVGILDSEQKCEFANITPEVMEMADRCMATYHPEDFEQTVLIENEQTRQNSEDGLWEMSEDRVNHYRNIGSALRRLTDSCKFWSKRQGLKGYITYVSSFIEGTAF